jgi:hypothetical protein
MDELDFGDAATVVDGPNKIGFEIREDTLNPTWKLRLPTVRSIP